MGFRADTEYLGTKTETYEELGLGSLGPECIRTPISQGLDCPSSRNEEGKAHLQESTGLPEKNLKGS